MPSAEIQSDINDFFCEKIFEAAIKLKFDVYPIAFLATNIYHRTCRALDIPNNSDTRHIVAAASLQIAAKSYGESKINLDDIIVVFYPFFFYEEIDLVNPDRRYETIKIFIKQMEWVIFKKLSGKISYKLPSEYLLEYLFVLQDILSTETLSNFDIPKASWTLVSDFYLCKQSIDKPEYIAIAAIYSVLRSLVILVPGCTQPESLDWAKVFVENITLEKISPILDTMLAQQVPVVLQEIIPPLPTRPRLAEPPSPDASPPPSL